MLAHKHGLRPDTQREFFFQKSDTFRLEQTNWHCESLVHGKMYLILFPTKNFDFQV